MSNFSNRDSQNDPMQTSAPQNKLDPSKYDPTRQDHGKAPATPPGPAQHSNSTSAGQSPQSRLQRDRTPSSRPMSMVQTYQPPLMDVSQDTLPELQPIFTFLNSHSNKLYQEGYFLKLDDQNTRTYLPVFEHFHSNIMQRADPMPIEPGPNVSHNL
jgi:CCR4-NOT transcriptional complex subunit CAF120